MTGSRPTVDSEWQQGAIRLAQKLAKNPEVKADREAFLYRWRGKPRAEILEMMEQYRKNLRVEQTRGAVEGEGDSDLWRLAALESLL